MSYRLYCRFNRRNSQAMLGVILRGCARERTDTYLKEHGIDTQPWKGCWEWDLYTDDQVVAQGILAKLQKELTNRNWAKARKVFKQGKGLPQEIWSMNQQDVRHTVYTLLQSLRFKPTSREPDNIRGADDGNRMIYAW